MIELPNITLVCIDCVNHGQSINAIKKTLERVKPAKTLFITDRSFELQDGIETVIIEPLLSKKKYSEFCLKRLYDYVHTSHCLIIQHDGYVVDENAWDFDFMQYDYIGAPWDYKDGRNVGNGGFSLRSKKLLHQLQDEFIQPLHPEDDTICRVYRPYLESKGIVFAPEELAHRFSYELHRPRHATFGFHGGFHHPYKPYVLVKRTGALGDLIMTEPLLRLLNDNGYTVVLDTLPHLFEIFSGHDFEIFHLSEVQGVEFVHFINLDMSYEMYPQQNRLKTYFEFAGIVNPELNRATLYPKSNEKTKLFKKYCILHIDEKDLPHRNVYGVNWEKVVDYLEFLGYAVFQIGTEKHEVVATEINCASISFMKYLIAGCDLFIGIDSGPLNIAMAYDKPCIGFFGSVNPEIVYPNIKGLIPIQSDCEYKHCYHTQAGSTVGVKCVIDANKPPCCITTPEQIINAINKCQNH